jgi:hypothetical protein
LDDRAPKIFNDQFFQAFLSELALLKEGQARQGQFLDQLFPERLSDELVPVEQLRGLYRQES